MTDEEKKAIEILRKGIAIGDFITCNWVDTEIAIKTVLNLIENQQKEIEKLKEENKLRNKVMNYLACVISNVNHKFIEDIIKDAINQVKENRYGKIIK